MTTTSNKATTAAPWLPVPTDIAVLAVGLLCMFSLTLRDLFRNTDAGLWNQGEHSHGPIMLSLSMWLMVNRWREFKGSVNGSAPGTSLAWLLFAVGVFFYVPGRALGIIYFEVFAFIPMLTGMVLLAGGYPLLKQLKFPLFFLIFMVPIPGFVLEPISQFVKLKISVVVTDLLWSLGYPISHTGVIISIGPYQLLVADACAGMRTLFMLEAMGIFYLNVVHHTSLLRNIMLGLLIVPISFTANTLRVLFLALLTYHFGDEVGQGYLHGFAGIVLFVIALVLIISMDGLLRMLASRFAKTQGALP